VNRTRALLGLAGFAAGIALVAITVHSAHADTPVAQAILGLLIVWSFVGCGLLAWARRPENRIGPIMVAVGFSWFLSSLQLANGATLYTIGLVCGLLPLGFLVHLVLAFPDGRLQSLDARITAGTAYLATLIVLPGLFFFDPQATDCPDCPSNELLISRNDAVADGFQLVTNVLGGLVALATLAILMHRWRLATAPQRRVIAPVLWAGVLAGLAAMALFASAITGGREVVSARLVTFGVLACIPLAFLIGLLRLRMTHLRIIRLVVELNRAQAPGRLREALARTLGDPDLALGYWLPGSKTFVDIAGQPLELPVAKAGSRHASTIVEREGRRVAVLVHDASLVEQPALLEAVGAAAGLALENERLQAELRAKLDELSASEERLRALIDASPLAIVESDLEGRIRFWNPAAEELYGWRSTEVVGEPLTIIPEETDEERDSVVRQLLRGETISGIEAKRLRKDGSRVDVALAAAPVRDATGDVVALMAISADISKRKRAEEELNRERDFVSALVDMAPVLVVAFDSEGHLMRFNRECERLTGYTLEEVRGKDFLYLFVPPEEVERVDEALKRVWAGDSPSTNENHWVTRDGQRRLILWANSVLRDSDGEAEYIVSVGLDITERKRAEEELRASRARIVEAGDAERRRLERNLHDGAQQRLVALSLALRMVHAQVLASPVAAQELLSAAGEELTEAIAELRELARGIHPAVLTDRGLPAALEALAGRAPAPVELRVTLDERLPAPIEAAAYYVVAEALTNVTKYASARSVSVSVARENGLALVEVADDGVGGADPTQGTGLRGLADRVEALDGVLKVESRPGGGTRVSASIPV
jgi:PAS domain S-box-containing protein